METRNYLKFPISVPIYRLLQYAITLPNVLPPDPPPVNCSVRLPSRLYNFHHPLSFDESLFLLASRKSSNVFCDNMKWRWDECIWYNWYTRSMRSFIKMRNVTTINLLELHWVLSVHNTSSRVADYWHNRLCPQLGQLCCKLKLGWYEWLVMAA